MKKAKKLRRLLSMCLSLVLVLSVLSGYGLKAEAVEIETNIKTSGYKVNEAIDQSKEVTLSIIGPGTFSSGEDGVKDIVTGLKRPGYKEIVDRWHEFYPNCALKIEDIPWDNYTSVLTAAGQDGSADILIHGTILGLAEDLGPYLEADPEYAAQLYSDTVYWLRMTSHSEDDQIMGIAHTLLPAAVWCDKEIFEHYGVELPAEDWTYDDLLEIAEKLTGTDPVTGEETYGIQYYEPDSGNVGFNWCHAAYGVGASVITLGDTPADATANYVSEESIKGFQILADMAKFASPECIEGIAVMQALNGTNNWAMLISEEIITEAIVLNKGEFKDRYQVVNMPVCTAGEYEGVPTPWCGAVALCMANTSDVKDYAWEFIKFMTTDEFAVSWTAAQGSLCNNVAAIDSLGELLTEDQMKVFDRAMGTLPATYNNAWNSLKHPKLSASAWPAQVTAVQNVFKGIMTPEEAAQSIQDAWDSDRLK